MNFKMWSLRTLVYILIFAFIIKTVYANQCLTTYKEVSPKRIVQFENENLNIKFEISKRVTQRLVTRIMKIFLEEVLGYPVVIVEKEDEFNVTATFARLSESVISSKRIMVPESMVNMEVWIPPDLATGPLLSKHEVYKSSLPITPPGHFGWFVPARLSKLNDTWTMFTKRESAARFNVDEENLRMIINATISPEKEFYCQESFCDNGMYIPPQCRYDKTCALLLADYSSSTRFIKKHIDHWKLYVKVAWVGPNLKQIIKSLTKEYLQNMSAEKSLVILHWTPSNIIPNQIEFNNVEFPSCKNRGDTQGCEYDRRKLEKLMWIQLQKIAKLAFESINLVQYNDSMYENLISRYNEKLSNTFNSYSKLSVIEEDVACNWLKDNLNFALANWVPDDEYKNKIYIGGIFPMSGTFYTAKSIVLAASMAEKAINSNNSILRDYHVKLLVADGQCKSEFVMKSFIDYILYRYYNKLFGVLGPACSETIEPLAGVSKHYNTVIMSYAAEGSSFSDKNRYPYFFRTIGENRQYKYVYLQLLKKFKWQRVAAFSEDGLKYTEYISYMQELLRENGITFVANIKFPREWQSEILTKYLEDLKQKRARIIISDVYDQVARLVMCEAYRLEMTAAQGYVWFLPSWLRSNWFDTEYYNKRGENTQCTTEEMKKAINGYLGISHASYAPSNSIMQEGITVQNWRDKYEKNCYDHNEASSPYAGYAYDAMWTYAYGIDQLLKENQSYIDELHSEHTVNRFTDIISKTDFNGVSGRIKFFGGLSRFPVINIYQHIDGKLRLVGDFHPNISEEKNEVNGGTLYLNASSIIWLSGKKPDDGSEPPKKCILSGFAELLNVSCEGAIVIANIAGFSFLGFLLLIVLACIKNQYDRKVRLHEKYLKSLGLDIQQPDMSSLDKWEIPRERVVINRKIGEGAFGTVYGGEAFFSEKGWLAVAVKTLKVGSSTEEKLNFLSEVEVMKRFEHKNIIKLLAVCIKSEPVLTVMEFALYGDLKTYLLARRDLVKDQQYEDSDEISTKKLTAMALDVARALSYLAQLKYIHRDVACRNCLVNAQRIVKLGDFGMTRPMYENDYYRYSKKGMLPVRWMAPESLGLGIFTPASDVWSFGVLLYEIITFGSFPFQGKSNNEVLTYVQSGNCLNVPKGVKPQLEELMKSCWLIDRLKRPSAPEIVEFLATNPRVISPCLDVPLASVQLEHTGQMEIQLNTSLERKFSFPWPEKNKLDTKLSLHDAPLLDINNSILPHDQNKDATLEAGTSRFESLRPLLGDWTDSPAPPTNNEPVRYVNMQPGISGIFPNSQNTDSNTYSIPMSERKLPLAEPNSNNNSIL